MKGLVKLVDVFLITGLMLGSVCAIRDFSIEDQLYNDLFVNYNSKLRPLKVTDVHHQILVHLTFTLSQIEILNEKEEHLISHGRITFSWTDQLLQWNASDYNGTEFLVLPAEDLWLPELTAGNSVKDSRDISVVETASRVMIASDGTVTWAPSINWKTFCPVDITEFPFDKQECEIEYANWMYAADLVNYTVQEQVETTLQESSGWNLVGAAAKFEQTEFGGTPYPKVTIKLQLRRNSWYFEVNILIPALVLSFLMMPMFKLPVDSGERVSLGVTLMLSYSVLLMMLLAYTPQSGSVPNISIALLVSFVFAGVALTCNIIVLNVHYHMPNKKGLKYLIERLARRCHNKVGDKGGKTQGKPPKNRQKMTLTPFEAEIIVYLEFFKKIRKEDDITEKIKDRWNQVAQVLDKIFFIAYLIYFIIYFFVVLSIKWNRS